VTIEENSTDIITDTEYKAGESVAIKAKDVLILKN
jgi:hypothetical protein